MNLSQALSAAVSGLRASQTGLSIVAANVANAETPGYVRKTALQVQVASNEAGISVRVASVNRQLDQYVQRQLRTETSGANYAGIHAQFYQRLQNLYGNPGSDSAIETVFNNFTSALQALAASPDDQSSRGAVISAAQVLTQQLRALNDGIQGLRSDAELGMADSVAKANNAMKQIAAINRQLASSTKNDATAAALMDQRDMYIDQLSQLMDINVVKTGQNTVNVFTSSGVQLVGTEAATLSFDARGTITPASQWSADPAVRSVGTITLTSPNGGTIDLIEGRAIRSGQIAAYMQARDHDLVQAQAQIDELAAGLARALSEVKTNGTAVTDGSQSGFDIDIAGLLAGNSFAINYTSTATGAKSTLRFIAVGDPSALPLSDSATADPNDRVIGLDMSGGMASVIAQINAALSRTGMTASNPSGDTIRFLDDGAANRVDITGASKITTATSLSGDGLELAFFLDAGNPYTGAITSLGGQSVGLAGRIGVNAALIGDPSMLVSYQSGTAAGDPARPNFIYDQLASASLMFSPDSGIGATATPFSGSLTSFLRQIISHQGEMADAAMRLDQGQQVVLNSLQDRFNEAASVNIDEEMANLLSLQNAYAANARVMSTVREMLDTLMNM